jgi:hypothetical protein
MCLSSPTLCAGAHPLQSMCRVSAVQVPRRLWAICRQASVCAFVLVCNCSWKTSCLILCPYEACVWASVHYAYDQAYMPECGIVSVYEWDRDCVYMCERYCKRAFWRWSWKRLWNRLCETTRKCFNAWFNRAYLQYCVQAMRAIKRLSPCNRVWLLALVHLRARRSKRACFQVWVFIIILLLIFVSV